MLLGVIVNCCCCGVSWLNVLAVFALLAGEVLDTVYSVTCSGEVAVELLCLVG